MQTLLYQSLDVFFQVIYVLIFVRIMLSWIPGARFGSIGSFIYGITEPILGPIREMLHASPIGGGMMMDFSPIISLFVMNIAKEILKGIIMLF